MNKEILVNRHVPLFSFSSENNCYYFNIVHSLTLFRWGRMDSLAFGDDDDWRIVFNLIRVSLTVQWALFYSVLLLLILGQQQSSSTMHHHPHQLQEVRAL